MIIRNLNNTLIKLDSNSDVEPEVSKSNPEELMTDGTDNVEMAVVEADQRVGLGVSIGPRVSKGIAMAMSKTVTEDNIDMEVSIIAERLDKTQTVYPFMGNQIGF